MGLVAGFLLLSGLILGFLNEPHHKGRAETENHADGHATDAPEFIHIRAHILLFSHAL